MPPAQVTRGGWLRARAGLSATLAAGLAVGGHALGGGAVPLRALSVPVLVAAVPCSLVASRRWTTPRLLLALSATQVVVHLWFTSGLAGGAATPMAGMPGMPGRHHAMAAGGVDARMLAWHSLGCLLSALLLTRAERAACWVLAGLVFARLRLTALLARPARTARPLVASGADSLLSPRLLTGGVGRRGPPALLALAMT